MSTCATCHGTVLSMEAVAAIDFETTGLSPAQGDRATEIAAVIVEDGRVVDRYQSLMNASVRITAYIEALTGITNAMVRSALNESPSSTICVLNTPLQPDLPRLPAHCLRHVGRDLSEVD